MQNISNTHFYKSLVFVFADASELRSKDRCKKCAKENKTCRRTSYKLMDFNYDLFNCVNKTKVNQEEKTESPKIIDNELSSVQEMGKSL